MGRDSDSPRRTGPRSPSARRSRTTRPRTSSPGSPPNHHRRWRPRDRKGPPCRYTFRDLTCAKRGAHYCEPRANRVVAFFPGLLLHTKGAYARRPFVLSWWQEHEVIRPLFGEVVWSVEWQRYVRRYRVAYIVVARKNGKSELVAGIILYLLVGDDEEAAEVYGAAKDTKQAGKVFEPAVRMMQLSPLLAQRLKYHKNNRRITDERTSSYLEVITADALGELGHNPHGFYLDEVLAQLDDSLWNAMRTAGGTRTQPLQLGVTTETNQPTSFGADMIDEAERIQEDPARAPHVFAYVRKLPRTPDQLERLRTLFAGHPDLPVSVDPFDERNWKWPNPALDDFLSRQTLREEALEARLEPAKENPFRQYRVNQRVSQVTRWMPLHLWDGCGGLLVTSKLERQRCFGGLDLSTTTDLTGLAWLFPDVGDRLRFLWRFWIPEEQVPELDRHLGGQAAVWVREGWITATPGNVIDYDQLYAQVDADRGAFKIVDVSHDRYLAAPVVQELGKRKVHCYPVPQTYLGMSAAMKELMRLVKAGELDTGNNPVARFCADAVEVRQDDQENIRPVKPDRQQSGKRIEGIVTAALAVDGWMRRGRKKARSRAAGF